MFTKENGYFQALNTMKNSVPIYDVLILFVFIFNDKLLVKYVSSYQLIFLLLPKNKQPLCYQYQTFRFNLENAYFLMK